VHIADLFVLVLTCHMITCLSW